MLLRNLTQQTEAQTELKSQVLVKALSQQEEVQIALIHHRDLALLTKAPMLLLVLAHRTEAAATLLLDQVLPLDQLLQDLVHLQDLALLQAGAVVEDKSIILITT
tara:strand:- start:11757 stop:12071 length:315 start_codon:yes stop_codon:yes gene_type:complete